MATNYTSRRQQGVQSNNTPAAPKFAAPAAKSANLAEIAKLFAKISKVEAAVFFGNSIVNGVAQAASAKITIYGTTASGHNLSLVVGSAAGGAPRATIDELKALIASASLASAWETEKDGRTVEHESTSTGESYRMLICTPSAVSGW